MYKYITLMILSCSFVSATAFLDIQDKNGNTALMCAVMCAHYNIVQLLVEDGADTSLKNNDGYTALDIAEALLSEQNLTPMLLKTIISECPKKDPEVRVNNLTAILQLLTSTTIELANSTKTNSDYEI